MNQARSPRAYKPSGKPRKPRTNTLLTCSVCGESHPEEDMSIHTPGACWRHCSVPGPVIPTSRTSIRNWSDYGLSS